MGLILDANALTVSADDLFGAATPIHHELRSRNTPCLSHELWIAAMALTSSVARRPLSGFRFRAGPESVLWGEAIRRSRSFSEEIEVAFARHPGRSEIVLDDEHRYGGVLGNHQWPDQTKLSEHHMITLGANVPKAVGLEDLDQLFVGNRAKPWHASAEAGGLHAAH
jgi:hypothetical protein